MMILHSFTFKSYVFHHFLLNLFIVYTYYTFPRLPFLQNLTDAQEPGSHVCTLCCGQLVKSFAYFTVLDQINYN